MRRPTPSPPLRHPAFRRYFAGQSLSALGDTLIPVALAFGVLETTHSAAALGIVLLASRLPMIVFTLSGGVLGDRLTRRTVMIGADLVRVATQTATGLLLVAGVARIWELVVLQAIAGTASAFFNPAAAGLIVDVTPSEERQAANALLGMTRSAAQLVGPALAAALVATVGAGIAFLIDAGTFAGSAISLALVVAPRAAAAGPQSLLAMARDGWGEFRSRTWLWVVTAHVGLLNAITISPFLVLAPIVSKRDLGGAPALAAIGVGYAAGALCGNAVALRWRPARPLRDAMLASLALAPLPALLAVAAPVPLIVAAAAAAGFQAGLYMVIVNSTVQTQVPPALVARLSAFFLMGGLVATPVGMAAAGPLAEVLSVRIVLLAGAVSCVLGAAAAFAVRDVRELTALAEPTPGPAPLPSLAEEAEVL